MKRWLSVMAILAGLSVASAGPSAAGATPGINLAWDECGAAGTVDRAFACDVNTGGNVMIASFVAPAGINLFLGVEVVIDIKSSTDPLPDWWRMRNQTGQTGQCRNGAVVVSADFLANTVCTDPFGGQGAGGIGTYRVGGPAPDADLSRVRLTMAFALAAGNEIPLTEGVEYYGAKVNILNSKTVGTGFCAGCDVPMSITLNGVNVAQPAGSPGGDVFVTDPSINRSITWQGGAGAPPVSTSATTWGQVKSLYR